MTRPLMLTLGLCLLPIGMVPPDAAAQTPPPAWTVTTSDADVQDSQQPKPSTNTTAKQQDELAREKVVKEERAQKEQAEAAEKKTQVSRVVRVGGPLGVVEDPGFRAGPNVRIEFTLTDQRSGAPTTNKTVMVTTSNQNWGKLRTEVYGSGAPAPLNVDARPFLLQDGRISLQLTVEYGQPPAAVAGAEGSGDRAQVRINESLTLVLENGKPLQATQSADPTNDRKVTVEVKATVLR